jgi:glucosamine--fructose-6-phosphate aminotransferase (isomerizing)
MCGIVGYIGPRKAVEVLLEGLRRLEYRGYDSAGVALVRGQELFVCRAKGKLSQLEQRLAGEPAVGALDHTLAIGHTRWATHGEPSDENAHPHRAGDVVVVHNGIIENYLELKRELEARGRRLASETDTEIVAHLVDERVQAGQPLAEAVRATLGRLKGSYALVVLHRGTPDRLVVAKNASPLIVGLGQGESFVASDIPALLPYTREVVVLNEGEMAELSRDGIRLCSIEDGEPRVAQVTRTNWSQLSAEKGGYKHFMLKEIMEQPRALVDTIRGRVGLDQGQVYLDGVELPDAFVASLKRVIIAACGTSWHAALIGRHLFQSYLKVPTEVVIASELQHEHMLVGPGDLFLAISQSGETADTMEALKAARARGALVASVCNVLGASIPRASDAVLYTHAGPEISVASTKAFSTQVTVLYLLAVHLARRQGKLDPATAAGLLQGLVEMPGAVERTLQANEAIRALAEEYARYRDMLYLGRGLNYPVALEGALKLKEISYIHAEGYPAGEMKHGPIALIDQDMPVVMLAPSGSHYDRIFGNLREVKARKARVLALASEGNADIAQWADDVLYVPDVPHDLQPLVLTPPLQLFAYHIADIRGTDVDQPRNLAKSVTVH